MPFSLKNIGSTYQGIIDVVFSYQIGQNLEVYVDNMIVKNTKRCGHAPDLEDILQLVRKYNVCLNRAKCSFRVQDAKFLGFMLTKRGIEEN